MVRLISFLTCQRRPTLAGLSTYQFLSFLFFRLSAIFACMNTITGTEAIQRMRDMRHIESTWFTMVHITWNDRTKTTQGLRTVKRCRLRAALPKEVFSKESDLYLPYIDLDGPRENQNRLCRKKLIRQVAFPPHFEMLKVNWF